jgi:hypothetical protein
MFGPAEQPSDREARARDGPLPAPAAVDISGFTSFSRPESPAPSSFRITAYAMEAYYQATR